jgi:WD40 repeat protein
MNIHESVGANPDTRSHRRMIPTRLWLLGSSLFLLAIATFMPAASFAEQVVGQIEQQSPARDWPVISRSALTELQPIYTLHGHRDDVTAIAISPDSAHLASGSADGELRIWDIASGDTSLSTQAHTTTITSLAWSPDGTILASSTTDRFVKLWDTQSGELLRTIEARLLDYVLEVRFTPDGKYLAIAGPECLAVLRDIDSGILYKTYHQRHCLPRFGGSVYSWGIDFSPQGDEIILGFGQPSCSCGSIQRWGMEVIAPNELIYGYKLPVKDLDVSPDGEDIAIAMFGTDFIRVIDADSIYPIRDLEGHMFRVNSVHYSPDGELLVSASNDRRIGLWDPDSAELLRLILGHKDAVTEARFSPDGTYLVSGSKDNLLIVWGIGEGS